jgi:cell division protein FtsI/penicillin-binding protein 2
VTPRLVEAVWTGKKRNDLIPSRQERVVSEATAKQLTHMLERTVAEGTARKSFHVGRRLVTGDVMVAGKTGTLADKEPFKDYSWFVGFAPSDNPQVTVSAVAVNGAKWRVRAAKLAADALRAYFVGETNQSLSRRRGR